jgi:hypothetical protein
MRGQRALRLHSRRECIARSFEDQEVTVTRRVHQAAAPPLENFSRDPAVILEQRGVRGSDLLKQASRALEVGEKESQRAGSSRAFEVGVGGFAFPRWLKF